MNNTSPPSSATPPPFRPDALPLERLKTWMEGHVEALGGALSCEKVDGGQSNPTWMLRAPGRQWVLRAKPAPAAQLMPSAHAIEREYQVLAALSGTAAPVPKVLALCEDESVMGVAFYVMEYVSGRVLRDIELPAIASSDRTAYFDAMCDTLVALHQVDWRAAGLQDYGRHNGYFSRLIRRWSQQYRASIHTPSAPMERLMEWLPRHIPPEADAGTDTAISHGDFRLENLIFHPDQPRVVAILDWELSTLGPPLSDLAYNCLAWHMPAGILRGISDVDYRSMGLPTQRAYLERYCRAAGRNPAQVIADWPFYLAFNLFRLGAILQGIAHRHEQGVAASASAGQIGRMALPVAQRGWDIASGTLPALDH